MSARTAALDALEREGLRWALLRDDPAEAEGGDTDLLVAPEDADRLDRVLAAAGFARILTWRHGYHRFFVAYEAPSDAWVKLDVMTHLGFRAGVELPRSAVAAALRRTCTEGGVRRLHPEDEFWALLLHCLLDRRSLPDRHLDRLARLVADRDPGGPLRAALAAAGTDAERALAAVRARDAAGVLELAPRLAAVLPAPPARARAAAAVTRRLAPILKAVRRPGISVAILGPDGAGKSTLIEALSKRFFFPARTYYLGLYGRRRRRRRPGGALVSQLTTAWATYAAAAFERRRGRLVIFDRYGYDALLGAASRSSRWKRRARALLLGRLAPRPDLVVVLDAPPERLLARKKEHPAEVIARQREGYRRLAARLGRRVNVEVVDADRDADAVRRDVTAAAWRSFAGRRGR